MVTRLEDFPVELFLCIFDYLWAHEIFSSFYHLNSRIDEIIFNTCLHISSENQEIIYSPSLVVSLTLTQPPMCLKEFINLRSLTLIRCNMNEIDHLPLNLLKLSMQNVEITNHDLQVILGHHSLKKVQLNLHKRLNFSTSNYVEMKISNSIRDLSINYISLRDLIAFLPYFLNLKSIYVSIFGLGEQLSLELPPLVSVTRLTCLTLSVPFDILCSQLLSSGFPNLAHLSIYTSYVDLSIFVRCLQHLLAENLLQLKKFNASAQIHLQSTSNSESLNVEAIGRRFRTAFWLKRNCRTTLKYCQNDAHTIRLYLQTSSKLRTRSSRFEN